MELFTYIPDCDNIHILPSEVLILIEMDTVVIHVFNHQCLAFRDVL